MTLKCLYFVIFKYVTITRYLEIFQEMRKEDKRDFEERYTACFVDFGLKISKYFWKEKKILRFIMKNS